jgi:hypothetical protein
MRLVEAGAAGATRIKVKMGSALTLARLHGPQRVDWGPWPRRRARRFAEDDLASILEAAPAGETRRADEVHSLQGGTRAWGDFGR